MHLLLGLSCLFFTHVTPLQALLKIMPFKAIDLGKELLNHFLELIECKIMVIGRDPSENLGNLQLRYRYEKIYAKAYEFDKVYRVEIVLNGIKSCTLLMAELLPSIEIKDVS